MVCRINIFLCIQLLVTSSLALPVSPESKHDKRSIPTSDPTNLLEKSLRESSPTKSDVKTTTEIPQNKFFVSKNKTEEPLNFLGERLPDFESNDFKIRVIDLPKLSKEEVSQIPQVGIGLPITGPETHINKVPEPYIIRVPHYIILREPQFVVNGDHFSGASFPEYFHPFGEFPGITQGFPSGDNIFDISQIYPSNPIEISQGFEGFPPISGASEIQGFPGFGDINQGFDIIQPEQISTVGFNDERFDHETDSVIVDAFENLRKLDKDEKTLNEKSLTNDKEKASRDLKAATKES